MTGDILDPNLRKIDGKTQTISVVGRDSPPQIVDNSTRELIGSEQLLTPKSNKKSNKSGTGKDKKPPQRINDNSTNSDKSDKSDNIHNIGNTGNIGNIGKTGNTGNIDNIDTIDSFDG